MIFRNPQLLLMLVILPLFVIAWRLRRGRLATGALVIRLVIATLVIMALANPIIAQPAVAAEPLLVVLVDQSASLGNAGKQHVRARAEILQRDRQGPTRLIYFGANTVASQNTTGQPVQAEGTDIAGAIRMARGLIGPGGGRVALLSDGTQTTGDALAAAQAFATAGIPIDTYTYRVPNSPEIWSVRVEVPRTLRESEEFQIQVILGSTSDTTARLELFAGPRRIIDEQVRLTSGMNRLTYKSRAGRAGMLSLRAVISGQPDTFQQNNTAATTTLIAPPPLVLLVEGQPGNAIPLRANLRPAGIQTEVIDAGTLPTQLSTLDRFEGIVLIDVPASNLTLDQMATLREFVRSEGRGLVATGGRASFTLGAYKDTPLEEVLPVTMTPPPRPTRSNISLLLIIDQSASMGPDVGSSKFNMAKESAILATDSLREADRIGVLAFDVSQSWIVNFQELGSRLSLGKIQEQIGQIPLGGGTDIYAALSLGLSSLQEQPGQVRHAVLLTDGRSFTSDRGMFRAIIERARAQNITLSAIAIGADSDTELLRELAQWGAGRYHFAAEPQDIPRLTLLESEIARTEPQVEGDFRADMVAPHPAMRTFEVNQLPRLNGYVATTVKPEAELVLRSPEGDPVLAAWQYGLGRAIAWTPSIEAPWANAWSNWPEYGSFWAQMIRYTLPEPDSGPLQVRIMPHGNSATISAEAIGSDGAPLDLADTQAIITLPDGNARAIPLRQVAPGRYAQEVALPASGPYAIEVRQSKDGVIHTAFSGYAHPYPDEYLPAAPGAGPILMARISSISGGATISGDTPVANPQIRPENQATELWPWFLLAAALLWPLEIAMRRGWVSRIYTFSR